MTKFISLLATLLFTFSLLNAQTVTPAPDRAADPEQAYPVTNIVQNSALKTFAADFPNNSVGFLHVYTDPVIDPTEVYLLKGNAISSTTRALLPQKFQRMAQALGAELYGAMSIAGPDESLYLLRMDGIQEDRIEMFAIRDNEVKHLRTIAYRNCAAGLCTQMDSYLTDLNGDGNLDLVEIKRMQTKVKERVVSRSAYVLNPKNLKWKKARQLDVPWDSIEFFSPSADNE